MAKKLTAGQRMIASAKQALAFAQGENNACVVHIPDEIDTARIRKKIKMSQSQFAAYFGVSVRTVQEWEQGRVVPSGAARAFLIGVLAIGLGPGWLAIILCIWAPLVALGRVTMGLHYLSDIVAGAIIGALTGGIILLIR